MLAYAMGLGGNIIIAIGFITGAIWVWKRDLEHHYK